VSQPLDRSPWQGGLTGQVFLGDEDFASRMQAQMNASQARAREIPRRQRQAGLDLPACLQACDGDRTAALCMAYREGGQSMTAQLGLSVSRVSRLIAGVERIDGEGLAKGKT
jgi:hypothetical protein